jgi:hypothetical protein
MLLQHAKTILFDSKHISKKNEESYKRSSFALTATLLWSVNVIASGIKDHIPPVGLAFGDGQCCVALALLPCEVL